MGLRFFEAVMNARGTLPDGLRLSDPAILLATWFGTGLLPKAPGSWGSLAALPFAWGIHLALGWPGLAAAVVAVFITGVWCSGVFIKAGGPDPAAVVIDEVAGQWLVLLVVPTDWFLYGAGFVFFRFADIVKPWPVSWADRRIKGGFGVMFDDVLAALYAGGALYALSWWTESW